MTSDDLSAARRRMTLSVPRGSAPSRPAFRPVSFSLIDPDPNRQVFRLVDGSGQTFDLALNPVVSQALRDCIDIAAVLADAPPSRHRSEAPPR